MTFAEIEISGGWLIILKRGRDPALAARKPARRLTQRRPCRDLITERHRGSMPPSTSRATEAAHPPALDVRTHCGWRAALSYTPNGVTIATPTACWPSHWLRCSQVRERATSEKWPRRTRTSARCPRAHAPRLRSVAHTSHITRRAGRAVRSRSRRTTRWRWMIWQWRHARTPLRPAPPASFPGLLHTQRR